MATHPFVIALFPSRDAASRAAAALHARGVTSGDLSIVARSHDEEVDAARAMGATPGVELEDSPAAARLGELGGYALAALALVMPGVGPVVAGGPLAAEFGEAAGHAAGSLADRLHAAGLARADADVTEAGVMSGAWLIGVHIRSGDQADVAELLRSSGATAVHHATWS